MIRIPALGVVLFALSAVFGQNAQRPVNVPLAQRIALPDGYGSEQDTESEGAFDFIQAPGVRGHILRRYVQSGDDKTGVAGLAAYFAGVVHDEGGVVLGNRLNNIGGRLDGRIPGKQPLWLHVEFSDEGGVIDVLLLDERSPVARELPLEETAVPGTWSNDEAVSKAAATLAPILQPYRGWEWRLDLDSSGRVRLSGLARSQACPACPIVTDKMPVTVATFDPSLKGAADIPSRRGLGEASLYQQQLIDKIIATIR